MKTKLTPIAAAAAVAIAGAISAPAFAQTAAAPAAAASAAKADDVQRVEVTGIRGSLQSAINQKRSAESHVEVITAEDIGKLPDKNVADSLARLPGVTISSSSGTEGGFDEADRVSMRGTSPSFTQTLINGHNIATGDWFVLGQTGTVGRSVSYTLLPSEIVSSAVVHKSSEASLIEGGVAGSVDIITRKPLEFKKPFTLSASAGVVYADLPDKLDGQYNGLASWKNEANTFGVLVQAFSETRHIRRDGVEVLGFDTIQGPSASNPTGDASAAAHLPGLVPGVQYPDLVGEALFEQERKRNGGSFDVELKPTDGITLDLNGFLSDQTASNINRNYMFFGRKLGGAEVPTNYTVSNGYLTSASYSDSAGMMAGIYDQISRPDAASHSQYLDFDGKFRATDKLSFNTKLGLSTGYGKSGHQDVAETVVGATQASFSLNGPTSAASWSSNATSTSQGSVGLNDQSNTDSGDGWIFGDGNIKVDDSEKWAQLDGEYDLEAGPLVDLKFGARASEHKRDLWGVVGQGPSSPVNWGAANYAAACDGATTDFRCIPPASGNYPSNWGKGLGANVPATPWTFSPEQLAAYDAQYTDRDPVERQDFSSEYGVQEKVSAAYIQGDLEGKGWSGNVGLRLVQTKEHIQNYVQQGAAGPGTVSSAFGSFLLTTTNHTYNDLLPSLNLKFDLSKEMLVRFAASRTMTRADYGQLAGAVSLNAVDDTNLTGSGTGGNPNLKPVVSNNFDASWEYYFAPQSDVTASVFYMDVTSNIGLAQKHETYNYIDNAHQTGVPVDFDLTIPVNESAKVHGFEVSWEQAIWGGFGANANGSITSATTSSGLPMLGTSKTVYNLGAYFENDFLNARVSWNHRSSFYSGLDRNSAFVQGAGGSLAASVGWTFNKHFDLSLEGRNLNKPILRYYTLDNQPRASYVNGAQYYLTAHFTY